MKKKKNLWVPAIILIVVSILYTVLVKFVDVGEIGPEGSSVGFQMINGYVHSMIGVQEFWYKVTKYLGILPFLYVGYYGVIGLMQLLKGKSLKKVDQRILALGGFYIVVGLVYVFFEKVVINYRPVILEEGLEASYPSSHTMLALCICLSSLLISKYYIKKQYKRVVDGITVSLMTVLVVGRILSGVHWITDIIGGVLISLALVYTYKAVIKEDKFDSL